MRIVIASLLLFVMTVFSGPAFAQEKNVPPKPEAAKSDFPSDDDDLPEVVSKEYAWKPLFDGKTLDGWSVPVFGGDGEVSVSDRCLVIGMGAMITGVKYERAFPKIDYEIRFEAMRTQGNDFFAALTFPYHDSCCTLVNGGWGGGITGLSSVDGMDASENETSGYYTYSDRKWYKFKLRVTRDAIKAWILEKTKEGKIKETLVIDLETEGKTISLRDETSQYQPLGFCTWVTEGRIRNLKYRQISPDELKSKKDEAKTP